MRNSNETRGGFFMHYTVFRRKNETKKKTVYSWGYTFIDPVTGKRRQKIIPGCKSRAAAYEHIQKLSNDGSTGILISDICRDMFIPGSRHLERLAAHGKTLAIETILQYRTKMEIITKEFGHLELKDLTVMHIENFLASDTKHSGSWKNTFLEALTYVYKEAPFYGVNGVNKPNFVRYSRNSKKADILTTDELSAFFNEANWNSEKEYLVFLCMLSFGLRIGEVRAIQIRQLIFDKNALVIDGFCKSNGERTSYNKKGSDEDMKWRVAVAPDYTMQRLYNYVTLHNLQPDEFLFTRDGFRPYRREYLEDVFLTQLDKAGIEKNGRKLIPHSLRFTYVTRMRRELPAEIVRKLVGHSSVEMTEYYTRAAIPELVASVQNAIPAVNQLFD